MVGWGKIPKWKWPFSKVNSKVSLYREIYVGIVLSLWREASSRHLYIFPPFGPVLPAIMELLPAKCPHIRFITNKQTLEFFEKTLELLWNFLTPKGRFSKMEFSPTLGAVHCDLRSTGRGPGRGMGREVEQGGTLHSTHFIGGKRGGTLKSKMDAFFGGKIGW